MVRAVRHLQSANPAAPQQSGWEEMNGPECNDPVNALDLGIFGTGGST